MIEKKSEFEKFFYINDLENQCIDLYDKFISDPSYIPSEQELINK